MKSFIGCMAIATIMSGCGGNPYSNSDLEPAENYGVADAGAGPETSGHLSGLLNNSVKFNSEIDELVINSGRRSKIIELYAGGNDDTIVMSRITSLSEFNPLTVEEGEYIFGDTNEVVAVACYGQNGSPWDYDSPASNKTFLIYDVGNDRVVEYSLKFFEEGDSLEGSFIIKNGSK